MIKLLLSPLIGISLCVCAMYFSGGVITRPDGSGKQVIAYNTILNYFIAPFKFRSIDFKTVWALEPGLPILERLKLLQVNWVALSLLSYVILRALF